MKKISVASLFCLLSLGSAQAGTMGMSGLWDFTSDSGAGFYDSLGSFVSTGQLTGRFDFDSGRVSLQSTTPFFGEFYFTDGTISDNGDGTYNGDLAFTWNVSTFPISPGLLWDITDHGDSTATVETLAGGAIIDGTLTSVPVPAAVWLFGTGLAGLLMVGRWQRC